MDDETLANGLADLGASTLARQDEIAREAAALAARQEQIRVGTSAVLYKLGQQAQELEDEKASVDAITSGILPPVVLFSPALDSPPAPADAAAPVAGQPVPAAPQAPAATDPDNPTAQQPAVQVAPAAPDTSRHRTRNWLIALVFAFFAAAIIGIVVPLTTASSVFGSIHGFGHVVCVVGWWTLWVAIGSMFGIIVFKAIRSITRWLNPRPVNQATPAATAVPAAPATPADLVTS